MRGRAAKRVKSRDVTPSSLWIVGAVLSPSYWASVGGVVGDIDACGFIARCVPLFLDATREKIENKQQIVAVPPPPPMERVHRAGDASSHQTALFCKGSRGDRDRGVTSVVAGVVDVVPVLS